MLAKNVVKGRTGTGAGKFQQISILLQRHFHMILVYNQNIWSNYNSPKKIPSINDQTEHGLVFAKKSREGHDSNLRLKIPTDFSFLAK